MLSNFLISHLVFSSVGRDSGSTLLSPSEEKMVEIAVAFGLSLNWDQNSAHAMFFKDYRALGTFPNIALSFLNCVGTIIACSLDEVR